MDEDDFLKTIRTSIDEGELWKALDLFQKAYEEADGPIREILDEFAMRLESCFEEILVKLKAVLNAMYGTMGEALEDLSDICDWDETCAYKEVSPKTYGISLLKNPHKIPCAGYSYKPVFRRNLPYQRRSY